MPLRRDQGRMDDCALLQENAQIGRIEHFMSEMGLPLEHLQALGRKEFCSVKRSDPTHAKYWLEGIIGILGQIGCSNKDKLGCVVSLLTDEAHRWWMTIKRGTVPDRLTWDFFLASFRRNFMGEQYLEARRRKFMELAQGTLSVDEYEAEFVRLSQYAPELVSFMVNCCKRFRFRLNHEIKLYLVAKNIEVFDELVEKARVLEETLGEELKAASCRAIKRSTEAASGSSRKVKIGKLLELRLVLLIRRLLHSRYPVAAVVAAPVLARGRGRGRGNGGRDAGQYGAAQGGDGGPDRVYAVRSFPLLALVDSGTTRLFILRDVARELGIAVETSRPSVTIKSPLGDSVVVDQVYRRCPLMVGTSVPS
ncbi:uncharacterized protein LOC105763421 [Gossypium raimondii]|uniref:uncharacterized protein LOC105763421 n=1 Tax=Gossypium raimondii TaxID=29730 RepID=UPI00063AF12F|nr:uncharacterized protein LOC105763421 [Gossypium raimondii]